MKARIQRSSEDIDDQSNRRVLSGEDFGKLLAIPLSPRLRIQPYQPLHAIASFRWPILRWPSFAIACIAARRASNARSPTAVNR